MIFILLLYYGNRKDNNLHLCIYTIYCEKYYKYIFFCRSTAELESFHNHLLMYSSKRYAYSPPVYRARNLLAALDYNENVDRQPIRNKDGTLRYFI